LQSSIGISPQKRKNRGIVGADNRERAHPEDWVFLAQMHKISHPVKKGCPLGELRFDVGGAVVKGERLDHWQVQLAGVGIGESGVSIRGPLHRGSGAVSVFQPNVVTHTNFIPVVKKGGPR